MVVGVSTLEEARRSVRWHVALFSVSGLIEAVFAVVERVVMFRVADAACMEVVDYGRQVERKFNAFSVTFRLEANRPIGTQASMSYHVMFGSLDP